MEFENEDDEKFWCMAVIGANAKPAPTGNPYDARIGANYAISVADYELEAYRARMKKINSRRGYRGGTT